MTTGRGELQRQPRLRLTQHIRQIRTRPHTHRTSAQHPGSAPATHPSNSPTRSARLATPHTDIPVANAASDRFPAGTIARSRPTARAASRAGSTPRTGRTCPSKPKLPDQHRLPRRIQRNHPSRRENRYRQSNVIPRTTLGQRRRRQRQRDPTVRPPMPGIHHRRPNPIPRLSHRRIPHADHRRPRQTSSQIRLHRNQMTRRSRSTPPTTSAPTSSGHLGPAQEAPTPPTETHPDCHAHTLRQRQPTQPRRRRMCMKIGHGNNPRRAQTEGRFLPLGR